MDLYMRWLQRVQDAVRKAFHSDARLAQDAEIKAGARALRATLEEAEPKDRFAIAVKYAMESGKEPLPAEVQEAAAALYKRRVSARDRLCAIIGKRPAEGWDDLYYRVYGDRRLLDQLGRELVDIGAMHDLPDLNPYARKTSTGNMAMSSEPSDAEDAYA